LTEIIARDEYRAFSRARSGLLDPRRLLPKSFNCDHVELQWATAAAWRPTPKPFRAVTKQHLGGWHVPALTERSVDAPWATRLHLHPHATIPLLSLHCAHRRASTQLRQYNLYMLRTFLYSANDSDCWIAISRLELSMTHEHCPAGSACTSRREISQQ
jgi:hypothetical protein